MQTIPRVLTIAGSDSGGGAGIQADLKTFTALATYGMSAITSITAQNTVGVYAIHDLPTDIIEKQIDVVAQDIGIDAAKTGMLSSTAIVTSVAAAIKRNGIANLVVDPVMLSKSGDHLLKPDAQDALVELILPQALVLTPNVPEAEVIAGMKIENHDDMERAAQRILEMGPQFVLMKGGHMKGDESTDLLFAPGLRKRYSAKRIDTKNTHGTGCTYGAAIAAQIAKGLDVPNAIEAAKAYLTTAIQQSLPLGQGHGPLRHFWTVEKPNPEARN